MLIKEIKFSDKLRHCDLMSYPRNTCYILSVGYIFELLEKMKNLLLQCCISFIFIFGEALENNKYTDIRKKRN